MRRLKCWCEVHDDEIGSEGFKMCRVINDSTIEI
jgi:hypothetical protein